jgi:hypothetical protein
MMQRRVVAELYQCVVIAVIGAEPVELVGSRPIREPWPQDFGEDIVRKLGVGCLEVGMLDPAALFGKVTCPIWPMTCVAALPPI